MITVIVFQNLETEEKEQEDDEEVELVEADVLYGNMSSGRGGRFQRFHTGRGSSRPYRGGQSRPYRGGQSRRGRNPPDQYGNSSTCLECGSVNHWVNKCPDRGRNLKDSNTLHCEHDKHDKTEDTCYHIALFQSTFDEPNRLKTLVGDSMNCGVLDCGASETVCGDVWFNCYLDSLDKEDRDRVVFGKSKNVFKFGDGKRVPSTQQASIPAVIGSSKVMITTDVVDSDIPLLLSKRTMKNAGTELNFNDDTALILGEKIKLRVTESGHYALPLCKRQYILEEVERNPSIKVTLSCSKTMSAQQQALKLHRQFAHPPQEKLLKLLRLAGKDDSDLRSEIVKVSKTCRICQEYRRPPPRPVVGLPMATTFNECVAMDLKWFNNVHLLHLIDHATRLSACAVIRSKTPEVVIREVFRIWISIYGCPEKFLSDNGGEFSNDDFREMAEKMNITVKTTGAEAPWSNGLCERHNQIIAEMLTKTMADTHCDLGIAVAWCINAKNSLHNVHGFSPFQLVFGKNPRIPGILVDRPPALDGDTSSRIVCENANAIHSARQAFYS